MVLCGLLQLVLGRCVLDVFDVYVLFVLRWTFFLVVFVDLIFCINLTSLYLPLQLLDPFYLALHLPELPHVL
jgi:hypothetical protein